MCLVGVSARAQGLLICKNATVSFYSSTVLEDIEAKSNTGTSAINVKTGEMLFKVSNTSFRFQKKLMQEHFNENYMESNTFPKADFKGAITNLSTINFSKDGTYPATVKGDLTIHGVTKNVELPGTVTVAQGMISAHSKFSVKVKDYNIKIPATVINNIAETIDVTVDCKYEPYKKG